MACRKMSSIRRTLCSQIKLFAQVVQAPASIPRGEEPLRDRVTVCHRSMNCIHCKHPE